MLLRAFVLHWDADELGAKVAAVEAAGAKVVGTEHADGTRATQRVKDLAPDVLVVWMSQLPSHGRTTAAAIRSYAWGRKIPCLFVHGDPAMLEPRKRAKLEEVIPDAILVTPATLAVWLIKVENLVAARSRPADAPAA